MSRILLAGVGAARDVRTYSGIPHFLLEAARLAEGERWDDLDLDVTGSAWRRRRYAWNLLSVLRGAGRGGYQFTDHFLERLWDPVRASLPGAHILNWTQLYPSSIARDPAVTRSFYIDQTLTQLFDGYGIRSHIRADVAADALTREADGYAHAAAVIATSEWGRRAVLELPGVDPDRAHAVPPGANLPLEEYERWAGAHRVERSVPARPLRLVFVGAHPVRKGLDRLLRAVRLARDGGARVVVDVVGASPDELPPDLGGLTDVTWHGRIDKATDLRRFLSVVAAADVGCLLSRAEASAIGLREYQALGLAVLGPDVGGCPGLVLPGAGLLVASTASDEEIATVLVGLCEDRDRVDGMRSESWRRRREVLWPAAVERIRTILG